MFSKQSMVYLAAIALCLSSLPVHAQAPDPKAATSDPLGQMHVPYGMPISLDEAKKLASAALAQAQKQGSTVAIVITDTAGELIYFEKMDGTENAAIDMSISKARSSVRFRRPTKAFMDTLASGGVNMRVMGMVGAVPVSGGIPLVKDGKMIGAIGISGGSTQDDEQVAEAGIAALK